MNLENPEALKPEPAADETAATGSFPVVPEFSGVTASPSDAQLAEAGVSVEVPAEVVTEKSDEELHADADAQFAEGNTPAPDPGNSPPEAWTAPATDEEVVEVRTLLAEGEDDA